MPDLATPLIAWYRGAARDLPWRAEGFGAWGVLVPGTSVNGLAPLFPRIEQ